MTRPPVIVAIAVIAPVVAAAFAGAGCQPGPLRHEGIDQYENLVLDTWEEVWLAPRTGTDRNATHVGYVQKRARPGDEPTTIVYDRRFRELGFITAAGRTYRRDEGTESDADSTPHEISRDGFDKGVLLLFEAPNRSVELRPVAEPVPAKKGGAAPGA